MPAPKATTRPAAANSAPGPPASETSGPSPVIAEVAPGVPTAGGDGLYDYRVPPELTGLVRPGTRLLVPLLGRTVEGFCVRCKADSDVPAGRLRNVLSLVDERPIYPESSLDLALWTAKRYLCQPGEVLRAAIPTQGRVHVRTGMKVKLAAVPADVEKARAALTRTAPIQAAVLSELSRGPSDPDVLRRRLGPQARRAIAALEARGLLTVVAVRPRSPRRTAARKEPGDAQEPAGRGSSGAARLTLTAAQRKALEAIASSAGSGGRVFVLHGVTGSGKTEVYLRSAAEVLASGRQVLLLIPEVALVPQTLDRVRSHLGSARVAVAHSYLGGTERLGYWEEVASGRADVVVGARSAIFAPLDRLGLIVLDEEHEDSYKQDEGAPRYHAREVAVRRAQRERATLILASATPSLEAYQEALAGRYTLLSLPERVGGRALPAVELVDMRAELASGNRSLFSRTLQAALARTLGAGQQAILFLNRRGHSTFVLCRDCGWVARCPCCDVSLTYHDSDQDLQCHYCGYHAPAADRCPGCGGHRVRYFGAGTQRVEDEVRLFHPSARVARLDSDVVRRPGEAARVLALFESGQADVLVGTQMVAKGLDIAGVGLVAAVAADSALHLPDFRAPEKTFRLLTQAAGRAGRGGHPGRVIIQTYNPDHPAIAAAARHDYVSFATSEIAARRALGYPPFAHLMRVEFSDPDEGKARAAAGALAEALSGLGFSGAATGPMRAGRPRYGGPAAAPLARLRGRWRWQVLVFCPDLEEGLRSVRQAIRGTTGREARGGRRRRPGGPLASVDVDPVSVM